MYPASHKAATFRTTSVPAGTILKHSDHEHNAAFSLHEHVRIPADDGIHLCRSHRLPVFAQMQPLCINNVGYLLCPHPAPPAGETIYNGFFYLHVTFFTQPWRYRQCLTLACPGFFMKYPIPLPHKPKFSPRLTKVAQFLHYSFLVFSMPRPAGHINNFNKFVPADHKYPDFDASSEKFPMKNEIRQAGYSNVTG